MGKLSPERLASARRYRENRTPEQIERDREKRRQWAKRNPRRRKPATPEQIERARAARRKWREANREKHNAASRRWWASSKDRINAYRRHQAALLRAGRSAGDAAMEALNAALGQNPIYAAVAAVVPSRLPDHVRDDAIQSLILAVLEGEIALSDVAGHAKRHIGAAYGLMGKFGLKSLDATIPGTDGLRLIDTIPSEEHA